MVTNDLAYHSDEETRLLRSTTNASITDDANSEARSKTSKTDGKTSTELDEALEEGHLHCDCHTGA